MSTETAPFTLKDPEAAPTYGDGPLSQWCREALSDPRDEVFVRLTLKVIAVMSVAMVVLYTHFHWAVVLAYLSLWGWYSASVILMLHNTMHRPFLRSRLLSRAHPYVMSFFFGIPTGYAEHHLGMHHVEDNMPEDLSSTMRFQRDSFLHFLRYFSRFFFLIVVELPRYLLSRRRRTMAKRALSSELAHQALIVASLALDWRFGLVAFALPYFTVRLLMMIGNWGQHAFLNAEFPNGGLTNSITCVNAGYNVRAFNDGYHIGHHLKANRHWTEMPGELRDNWKKYAEADAIVFEGLDFFLVSLCLWTGQWGVLAKRFVRLDGKPRSDEEVITMLKSRVRPVKRFPDPVEEPEAQPAV